MKTFRVAVTGGRDHEISQEEAEAFRHALENELIILARAQRQPVFPAAIILHGNCRGVDQRAAELAESWGYAVVPFEAPWNGSPLDPWFRQTVSDGPGGRSGLSPGIAGPLRNWMMLKAADLLVAFPGGRGTADSVRQAGELGVRVVRVGG